MKLYSYKMRKKKWNFVIVDASFPIFFVWLSRVVDDHWYCGMSINYMFLLFHMSDKSESLAYWCDKVCNFQENYVILLWNFITEFIASETAVP